MSRVRSFEMKHSTDVVSLFMEYLPFRDLFQAQIVCKSWHMLNTKRFFHRLCSARNVSIPKDYGKGCSMVFHVKKLGELWRRHIIARETILNLILVQSTEPLHCILNYCCKNTQNYEIQVEGCRLITQMFDDQMQSVSEFHSPTIISIAFMKHIVNALDRDINSIQIASKTIGILSINEANRKTFAELRCIPKLLQSLSAHIHNKQLISCVLWSLVVLSRPIGGIEAQVFDFNNKEYMCNVLQLTRLNCVDIMLDIATLHSAESLILAKVFWLMVNLSLIDEAKERIIRNGSIEIICNSLRLYPNDKELQYRAIFAIVNLGLHPIAKERMLQQNGVQLIIQAMQQFPDDTQFLTMSLNATRSLSSQSPNIVHALIKTDAHELFQDIVDRYKLECRPLASLTRHTIQAFFGH
eukprot:349756_1